jgi:predicted Zn-dependent protease
MSRRRALAVWGLLLALAITTGVGTAFASHRWGCWRYADGNIFFFNGGTGDYFNIYNEEAFTDPDSWNNYTDINLISVSSAGTTDHINAFNGFYGTTGWLGLAEIRSYSGCTIFNGRTRLNQSYLDNGSYTRNNKKHVACQEIGHLLGINHNRSSTTTCMNDTILTAPQPNTHDRDLVNSIY